jgi:hypothetical protein
MLLFSLFILIIKFEDQGRKICELCRKLSTIQWHP